LYDLFSLVISLSDFLIFSLESFDLIFEAALGFSVFSLDFYGAGELLGSSEFFLELLILSAANS
jgi:hypothetical protein